MNEQIRNAKPGQAPVNADRPHRCAY